MSPASALGRSLGGEPGGGDGERVDEVVHRLTGMALDPAERHRPGVDELDQRLSTGRRWRPAAACELRQPFCCHLTHHRSRKQLIDVGRVGHDHDRPRLATRRRAPAAPRARPAAPSAGWWCGARRPSREARRRARPPTPIRPARGCRSRRRRCRRRPAHGRRARRHATAILTRRSPRNCSATLSDASGSKCTPSGRTVVVVGETVRRRASRRDRPRRPGRVGRRRSTSITSRIDGVAGRILLTSAVLLPPDVRDRRRDPGDRAGTAGEQARRSPPGSRSAIRVSNSWVERGQSVAVVPAVVDDVPRRDHQHHDVRTACSPTRSGSSSSIQRVAVRPATPSSRLAGARHHARSRSRGADDLDLGQLGVGGRPRDQTGDGGVGGRVAGDDDPHRARERRQRWLGRVVVVVVEVGADRARHIVAGHGSWSRPPCRRHESWPARRRRLRRVSIVERVARAAHRRRRSRRRRPSPRRSASTRRARRARRPPPPPPRPAVAEPAGGQRRSPARAAIAADRLLEQHGTTSGRSPA